MAPPTLAVTGKSPATWMDDTAEAIKNVCIKDLCIPGTHDSATASVSLFSSIFKHAPGILLAGKVPVLGLPFRMLGKTWARSQTLSLVEQLNAGVRYLDLRICFHADKFHFEHSMGCGEITDEARGLPAVAHWLDLHPREIVFLDFNHMYGMTEKAHDDLSAYLMKLFGSRAVRRADPGNGREPPRGYMTPADLWAAGTTVFLSYAGEKLCDGARAKEPRLFDSPYSRWPGKETKEELKKVLDEEVEKLQSDGYYTSNVIVLQALFTPAIAIAKGIASGLCLNCLCDWTKLWPTNLVNLGNRANRALEGWLANDWKEKRINIVIVDSVHQSRVVELAVEKNCRGKEAAVKAALAAAAGAGPHMRTRAEAAAEEKAAAMAPPPPVSMRGETVPLLGELPAAAPAPAPEAAAAAGREAEKAPEATAAPPAEAERPAAAGPEAPPAAREEAPAEEQQPRPAPEAGGVEAPEQPAQGMEPEGGKGSGDVGDGWIKVPGGEEPAGGRPSGEGRRPNRPAPLAPHSRTRSRTDNGGGGTPTGEPAPAAPPPPPQAAAAEAEAEAGAAAAGGG